MVHWGGGRGSVKKSKFKFKQIILYDVINAEEGHRSIAYRRLHSPHVTMRVRILLEHTVQNQSVICLFFLFCWYQDSRRSCQFQSVLNKWKNYSYIDFQYWFRDYEVRSIQWYTHRYKVTVASAYSSKFTSILLWVCKFLPQSVLT